MTAFYHDGYDEPGLTTELPSDEALGRLMASGFKGSAKDFSHVIAVLRALGARPGHRLLDYGANWGYASHQFREAGFSTSSYELSVPRARFGRKLGIEIATDLSSVRGPFDIVYSSHVLEHVPDPLQALRDQLVLTRLGGLLVAHTPNGSRAWRESDPAVFRKVWGKAHPVLLDDVFVRKGFGRYPTLITSRDEPESLAAWDRASSLTGDLSGPSLFFAIVNRAHGVSGPALP